MKTKSTVLAAALLLSAIPSFAAPSRPCVVGTLASYIALGPQGCSLGVLQFGSFSYKGTVPGVSAQQIIVTPGTAQPPVVAYANSPGLTFSAKWQAASGAIAESVINYTVASLSLSPVAGGHLTLILGPVQVRGIFGSVTVDEATNVGTLSVYEQCTEVCRIKPTDQLSYTLARVLQVSNTVALNGGSNGASLSSFTATYSTCPMCALP